MAIKEIEYKNHIFSISYLITNPDINRDIIFLHGWGSNKEIMQNAFKYHLKDFRHIYIDMPGFGESSNGLVLNSSDYKNIIEIFLKEVNSTRDIVLGHSFGGKIATLLKPNILILLSSAGIITKKPLDVKMKIIIFKIFKKLGFGYLYKMFASKDVKSMDKNMYETFKNVVDEDFSDTFKSFSGYALIFWGKKDKATPLKNGEKIYSLIKNSKFYKLDGDHFFFLKHRDFISKIIHQEMKNLARL